MFISVKELELKKVHFEVAFPPGEIEYVDDGDRLSQATPLQAEGSAELLPHTLGEIRVRGHLAVTMRCDCNRCLEPAEFSIDSSFDLFYRPAEAAGDDEEEVEIDEGEAEIAFYEGDGIELKGCFAGARSAQHADAAGLPRGLPGDMPHMRPES